MSGYHAVSVLADAIAKGNYPPADEALAAMVSTSTVPYYEGLEAYIKLGYVPLEQSATAASTTLEYAYDDWTIYQTALKAGNEEVARTYRERALNYRNPSWTSCLRCTCPSSSTNRTRTSRRHAS